MKANLENVLSKNFSAIAGIDEAGRGPLAGPVVAAAVIIDCNNIIDNINDSKKISAKKRNELFIKITEKYKIGVGIANIHEIDQLNILQATKLAMLRATQNLPEMPDYLLIDGNAELNTKITQKTIIKGDQKILSIAAASIIAKVTRDRIMLDLHDQYPEYNWAKNSGYGTKEHIKAIEKYGINIHHRKSFAPIKNIIIE